MKGTNARTRLAPWAATVGARKDAGATRMPPRHKFREGTPMSTLPRGADRRVGPDGKRRLARAKPQPQPTPRRRDLRRSRTRSDRVWCDGDLH